MAAKKTEDLMLCHTTTEMSSTGNGRQREPAESTPPMK